MFINIASTDTRFQIDAVYGVDTKLTDPDNNFEPFNTWGLVRILFLFYFTCKYYILRLYRLLRLAIL